MYAIQKYVLEKMKEKNLKKGEFVKRLGYSNISKGCRRFDLFLAGEDYPVIIINNLHTALDIDKDVIDELIRETEISFRKEKEEERLKRDEEIKRNFVPYLYCQTERRMPSPIFACAILGADRMRFRNLPLNFNDLTPEKQNRKRTEIIRETLSRYNGDIPTFGKIICFTERLCFDDNTTERKVYNLKGTLLKSPDSELQKINEGEATLTVKGQDITRFFKGRSLP